VDMIILTASPERLHWYRPRNPTTGCRKQEDDFR